MLTVGSLFSGIGGFDLGLERTGGFRTRWFCEINPFRRRILQRRWPGVPIYHDAASLGRPPRVQVLAGGFPCQPNSQAGRRRGRQDARWLWPLYAGAIRKVRPRYVLVENVPGLLSVEHGHAFGEVLGDLATLGYHTEWDCIPALAVGAPHRRDRVLVVAHRHDRRCLHGPAGILPTEAGKQALRLPGPGGPPGPALADADGRGQPWPTIFDRWEGPQVPTPDGRGEALRDAHGGGQTPEPSLAQGSEGLGAARGDWWAVEPAMGRVADGVPRRVDRLAALGDAIVPHVAQWLGERILEAEAG